MTVEDNEQVEQEESEYQSDKEDQRSLSQTPSVGQPRMSGPSTDRRPARHILAEEKCQQRDH